MGALIKSIRAICEDKICGDKQKFLRAEERSFNFRANCCIESDSLLRKKIMSSANIL